MTKYINSKKSHKKTARKLAVYIIFISAILISFCLYTISKLNQSLNETVAVEVPEHSSATESIEIVNSKGLLQPLWLFKLIAYTYLALDKKYIYAGFYKFPPKTSNLEILQSITSSRNIYTISVTFPEGITIERFAEILASKLGIIPNEFLKLCRSDSVLRYWKIPAKSLEGYLMPNTYKFYYKQEAGEILARLIKTQNSLWTRNFESMAKKSGKSRHEILTLASIIEVETPVLKERKRVAGLYYNRLRIGMRLEADPTVRYGLNLKRKLTYSDLKIENPYNTYLSTGLPPGPINCPGESSIEAALNPEKNDYIYFVSIGDGSGKHNFSTSYQQHLINKRQFKKNEKRLE